MEVGQDTGDVEAIQAFLSPIHIFGKWSQGAETSQERKRHGVKETELKTMEGGVYQITQETNYGDINTQALL